MNKILAEAKRLHKLGLGVLLLHPRSKRPKMSKWTTGPRQPWIEIEKSFGDADNMGVRLGEASKIGENYLACIDVDIKDPAFKAHALARLEKIVGLNECPEVLSGSGNGSRHLYCVTKEPFKMITVAKSEETFKDEQGRKHHKWEICVYSTGRQMVIAPSIHPDTGKEYRWRKPLLKAEDLPLMTFEAIAEEPKAKTETKENQTVKDLDSQKFEKKLTDFEEVPVDLDWLPISNDMRMALTSGEGVKDRSGFLLKASAALLSAGLTQNEVLTVLTDPDLFMGKVGYEHAGNTKSRRAAAAWVYRYTLARVESERDPKLVFGPASEMPPARKLSDSEAEETAKEFRASRHWRQDLERGGQNGDGAPKSTIQNVVLILRNAVAPDVVRRDVFALRDTYSVATPWGGVKDHIIGDDDTANIKFWLGREYGFEPKKDVIYDALTVVACQNAYDPVRAWLDGLPAWDGRARLGTWLVDNFEAKGDADYLNQVFTKWICAMVLRVYHPGLKFDWMPIFEGAQGVGKSSFGRLLAGDTHFLDWLPNLHDKDAAHALQGMWGVEMGELSQFRKNELESIKAFVTRTVDKFRPPYGRKLVESPRRCVFFGTTNRSTYLTDDTGNRRFKPVEVGSLNFKALRKERAQLFAEAKTIIEANGGPKMILELTDNAKVFEQKIQREKMVEDESDLMIEAMQDFLQKVAKNEAVFNPEKFQMSALFGAGGPLTNWKYEGRNVNFAVKMLKKMGFEKWKSGSRRGWKTAENGDFF